MKGTHRTEKRPAVFTIIISGNHHTERLRFQLFIARLPLRGSASPRAAGSRGTGLSPPGEAAASQAPPRPPDPGRAGQAPPGPAAALTARPAAPPLVRGTSGYSRALGSGLRCRHRLRGGGPEGSASGKGGKQTWGRREPGAGPSARSGPGAEARPTGGRLRAHQAGYRSALSPAGRGGAAPPPVSRGHGSGRPGAPPPASAPIRTSLAKGRGPGAHARRGPGRCGAESAGPGPGGGPGCRRNASRCGFGLPSSSFKAVERALEPE